MEKLKQYIINFYETHDKYISLNFYTVSDELNIDENALNTMLHALILDKFIICTQFADNVPYCFRLNQ